VPKAMEAVWKIESTRLIAAIDRVTHDIGTRLIRTQERPVRRPAGIRLSALIAKAPSSPSL
jgi:hypothetical protein